MGKYDNEIIKRLHEGASVRSIVQELGCSPCLVSKQRKIILPEKYLEAVALQNKNGKSSASKGNKPSCIICGTMCKRNAYFYCSVSCSNKSRIGISINNPKHKDKIIKLLLEGRNTNYLIKELKCSKGTISKYRKQVMPEEHAAFVKTQTKNGNSSGKKVTSLCVRCGTLCKRNANKYCSVECRISHKRELFINRLEAGLLTGVTKSDSPSSYIKNFLIEKRGEKCELCGWSSRNIKTDKIPIQCHHIDGDYSNNALNNLQLLCPNCHSLTPTYGGSNRGNGRKNRYKEALSLVR